MAAEQVAEALMAMDDPAIRRRVGEGDFAVLGMLELTAGEEALMSGSTPLLPDAHPSKQLVPFDAADVEAHRLMPGQNSGYWPEGTARAIRYVQSELSDPQTQARFRGWVASAADRFP